MIEFVVYGVAKPAGSKTTGTNAAGRRFVRDANPASREWKQLVSQRAGEAMNGRVWLAGPLELRLTFVRLRPAGHYGRRGLRSNARTYPTVAPDTTKLVRAVEDALTGIVYRDDAQVVTQVARKVYGEPARVEVSVRELPKEGSEA